MVEITREKIEETVRFMVEMAQMGLESAAKNGESDALLEAGISLVERNSDEFAKLMMVINHRELDEEAWPESKVYHDCRDLALEEVLEYINSDSNWSDSEEVVLGTIHNAQVAWSELQQAMDK